MSLQTIEYHGWKDCLLLDNGDIELVVSVGLGPRVLSFKRKGGANFFKNFDDQMANISQDTWQSYGGHRLWHAPEVWTRTYYPDVQPVKYTQAPPSMGFPLEWVAIFSSRGSILPRH